jgi:hypothetical protein
LLSPNFFLDTPGCVAKIIIPALQDFNAGMIIFRASKKGVKKPIVCQLYLMPVVGYQSLFSRGFCKKWLFHHPAKLHL